MESTLALKPRTDVIRSPKQGSHKIKLTLMFDHILIYTCSKDTFPKYVDRNGQTARLVAKRSAHVELEVSRRIRQHAVNEVHKLGDPPWLCNQR